MQIKYKTTIKIGNKKHWENKRIWLEPRNIVSISHKRNSKLDMTYVRVVDCNNRVYNIYDQDNMNEVLDYQEKRQYPFKNLRENLELIVIFTILGLGAIVGSIHVGVEHSSQIQNAYQNSFLNQNR